MGKIGLNELNRLRSYHLIVCLGSADRTVDSADRAVDSALAADLGLHLVHVDTSRTEEIADTVMGLFLGLLRRTHLLSRHALSASGWLGFVQPLCRGMHRCRGLVLGIVGISASARSLATCSLAFKMSVLYFDTQATRESSSAASCQDIATCPFPTAIRCTPFFSSTAASLFWTPIGKWWLQLFQLQAAGFCKLHHRERVVTLFFTGHCFFTKAGRGSFISTWPLLLFQMLWLMLAKRIVIWGRVTCYLPNNNVVEKTVRCGANVAAYFFHLLIDEINELQGGIRELSSGDPFSVILWLLLERFFFKLNCSKMLEAASILSCYHGHELLSYG
ncbi:C-terminal binding protein [Vigna angularis]|uniref:C-terminal binding protein n=1 Tax=Phaseolus angularis TaxID=3914 RepID=A0A8T0LCM6_PHAAN|nr:C-terminal binding protein [Vigna angularis]